jgi:hypothetical protein
LQEKEFTAGYRLKGKQQNITRASNIQVAGKKEFTAVYRLKGKRVYCRIQVEGKVILQQDTG